METQRIKQRKFLLAVVFLVIIMTVVFAFWHLWERNKSIQKTAVVSFSIAQEIPTISQFPV